MKPAALLLLFSLLFCSATSAGVIRVPADKESIALGLQSAGPGDTVLVSPGTYMERLTWPFVDRIKLIGEAGPEETIIDANGIGSVIQVGSGVDTTTLVRGFTLRNGRAFGG